MDLQINQYPNSAITLVDGDVMDVDKLIAALTFQSQKLSWADLKNNIRLILSAGNGLSYNSATGIFTLDISGITNTFIPKFNGTKFVDSLLSESTQFINLGLKPDGQPAFGFPVFKIYTGVDGGAAIIISERELIGVVFQDIELFRVEAGSGFCRFISPNSDIRIIAGAFTAAIINKITGNLELPQQIKISGGSPGVNKVLTSDAAGLGTWVAPPKIYRALISQTGILAPTVDFVLEDTTGVTISYTRQNQGDYRITSSLPLFVESKTLMSVRNEDQILVSAPYYSFFHRISDTVLQYVVRNRDTHLSIEGVLNKTPIEIIVYS